MLLCAVSTGAQTISYFNQGFLRQPSAELDRNYLGISSSLATSNLVWVTSNALYAIGASAYVKKAGDSMSGPLTNQIVDPSYLDNLVISNLTVISGGVGWNGTTNIFDKYGLLMRIPFYPLISFEQTGQGTHPALAAQFLRYGDNLYYGNFYNSFQFSDLVTFGGLTKGTSFWAFSDAYFRSNSIILQTNFSGYSVASSGFYGNGSGLTNIPIANIVSPGAIVTNGMSVGVTLSNGLTVVGIVNLPITNSSTVLKLGAYGTTNDQPNMFYGTGFPALPQDVYGNLSIGQYTMGGIVSNCSYNVGIGLYTLQQLQSGNGNVGLGVDSMVSLKSGNDNFALGHSAGNYITNGSCNIAIGQTALGQPTYRSASNNVAIGHRALTKYVRSEATAIGYNALTACVSNEFNTAIGVRALGAYNSTGNQYTRSTAVGYQAASAATSGRFITAFGAETMQAAFTTDYADAFGYNALAAVTGGYRDTGIGAFAMNSLTTGSDNASLGYGSGSTLTTGWRNTLLGSSTQPGANNRTNGTAVGFGAIIPADNTIQLGNSNVVGVVTAGTLTATNGIVQMVKPSFATNFTCTTNLQTYLCNGTNQVVTLPNAANVPNVVYRFASTNGWGSFILTNATGAQTIRDGVSLSHKQIGITPLNVMSDGSAWWFMSKDQIVNPNAQFSTSTNITLTAANTAYPVTFNSIDFNNSQGIALGAGTNGLASKMWITNSGEYMFSPSIVMSFGGNNYVRYWFRSNGTNIPNSCTPVRGQNNTVRVVTVPFLVSVTQPTAFEIWAESDSTTESLLAQAASGNYPAAPSVICPVMRISDIWP